MKTLKASVQCGRAHRLSYDQEMRKRELLAEYAERWQYRGLQRVLWSLTGAATSRAVHPEIGTSKWALKMWHQAGARAAHKKIRASGRRCCEEACRAAAEKRRVERERKEKDRLYGSSWRSGQSNLDGI